MKRFISFAMIVLLIVLCITLCGCGSVIPKATVITDPAEYRAIWTLSGTKVGIWTAINDCYDRYTPPTLFPSSTRGLSVQEFYAKMKPGLVDDTYQVLLSVEYEQDEFEAELARIEGLVTIEDTAYFDLPAAITVLGWEGCSEYALIDSDTQTIHYIYLQLVNPKKLQIPDSMLPNGLDKLGYLDGVEINYYLTLTEQERIDLAQTRR